MSSKIYNSTGTIKYIHNNEHFLTVFPNVEKSKLYVTIGKYTKRNFICLNKYNSNIFNGNNKVPLFYIPTIDIL